MKLIKAEVNWMEGWANDPRFVLTVDKIPDRKDLRYKRFGQLFFAEKDGYVSFFVHSPGDEHGYGGATFNLTLTNGDKIALKGPWSSRSGVMNQHFQYSLEVTLIEQEGRHKGARLSGAVTLDFARQAAEMAGVKLVKTLRWDDEIYFLIEKGEQDETQENAG